jgi:hypothetical protein
MVHSFYFLSSFNIHASILLHINYKQALAGETVINMACGDSQTMAVTTAGVSFCFCFVFVFRLIDILVVVLDELFEYDCYCRVFLFFSVF